MEPLRKVLQLLTATNTTTDGTRCQGKILLVDALDTKQENNVLNLLFNHTGLQPLQYADTYICVWIITMSKVFWATL